MSESKNLGKRNRQKGHHAERFYVDVFKTLGYSHCITARLGGRVYDNAGIDIINIPFNIQVKAGKQTKLSAGKILLGMESQIKSLFPPEHEVQKFPLILIHRPNPYSKNYNDDMVYLTKTQFDKFKLKSPGIEYLDIKKRNARMSTEFGEIISIKFSELLMHNIFKKDDLLQ